MDSTVYEPSDDSFMLAAYAKKLARGEVLDMGTGSGLLAEAAMASPMARRVVGADIDRSAVEHCRKKIRSRRISFLVSNLFSNLSGKKFDTIIFNPPYLPEECAKDREAALIGGKKGYETIQSFMGEADEHLKDDGFILLLFSSLTGKEQVDRIILDCLFIPEELERKRIFFEELYIYRIRRSKTLETLHSAGISGLRRFSKGKRGLIYKAGLKGKRVAVKIKNPESRAVRRIKNEGEWLKELNKKGIGPKLLISSGSYLIYKFEEGKMVGDYIESAKKARIKAVLSDVMNQMRGLDELKVDKEEMHHPWKHIVVGRSSRPVLLDFERCRKKSTPKNVTQFIQYLNSGRMRRLLKRKGIAFDSHMLAKLAQEYKASYSDETFSKILQEIRKG